MKYIPLTGARCAALRRRLAALVEDLRTVAGTETRPLHVMTRFSVNGATAPLYYCSPVPPRGALVFRVTAAYSHGRVDAEFDLELKADGSIAWTVTERNGTTVYYDAEQFSLLYGAREPEIALLDIEGDTYDLGDP